MKQKMLLVLLMYLFLIGCVEVVSTPKVTIKNKSSALVISECARWLVKNDYCIDTSSLTRIVGKSNELKIFNSLFDPWVYREYLEFIVFNYSDSVILLHSAWRVYNEDSHKQKIQYENSRGEAQRLQRNLDSIYAILEDEYDVHQK